MTLKIPSNFPTHSKCLSKFQGNKKIEADTPTQTRVQNNKMPTFQTCKLTVMRKFFRKPFSSHDVTFHNAWSCVGFFWRASDFLGVRAGSPVKPDFPLFLPSFGKTCLRDMRGLTVVFAMEVAPFQLLAPATAKGFLRKRSLLGWALFRLRWTCSPFALPHIG